MKSRRGAEKDQRVQAERILARRTSAPSPRVTRDEALQELQVHQIELELQVEKLRRTEAELENIRDRYMSLYDEAPVGYVTLDAQNLITQANNAAAGILGASRESLVGSRFSSYLAELTRPLFIQISADARAASGERVFDARILRTENTSMWAEIHAAADPGTGELRITLIDITEQREASRQLRALAERLITLQERERSSIAAALHDEAGQQLTYLCILLDRAREAPAGQEAPDLDEAVAVARRVLQGMRELSASLSPAEISRVGLVGALHSMIAEFAARTHIDVFFNPADTFREQPFRVSLAAYRIAQEALTNSARHAKARSVRVVLTGGGSRLLMEVVDDGIGFEAGTVPASLGLLGMRERARSVGGRLDVMSVPGQGTRVVFQVGHRRQEKAAR